MRTSTTLEYRAEAEFLQAAGVRRYKAAFYDRRIDKVIDTGAIHDVELLTAEQRRIIDEQEAQNVSNYKRRIADGFIDTATGQFLYREELQAQFDKGAQK